MTMLFAALFACAPAEVPLKPDMFSTDSYTVHLTPSADPFLMGEEITLGMHVMQDDIGVAGLDVDVEPFMPDMGHGISTDVLITEMEMGMYEAAFTFSMAGHWELTLDVDGETAVVGYAVE